MRGFNYKKAVQALNLIAIKNGGSINKMKAIKLIWLSDRLHLRKFGRSITGDTYYALQNGPVPSATRDILETSFFSSDIATEYASEFIAVIDKYHYKSKNQMNLDVFSQTDKDILEIIFNSYKSLDQFQLSELSHLFPEWQKFQSALENGLSSRFSIDLADFFINFKDDNNLFIESDDLLKISKDIFEENSKLLSVF
jgi:uncharacterized phage-associated protein